VSLIATVLTFSWLEAVQERQPRGILHRYGTDE